MQRAKKADNNDFVLTAAQLKIMIKQLEPTQWEKKNGIRSRASLMFHAYCDRCKNVHLFKAWGDGAEEKENAECLKLFFKQFNL